VVIKTRARKYRRSTDTEKIKFVNSPLLFPVLIAVMATADMLLMNPLAKAAPEPADEAPIEIGLVRAVLAGDRDGFNRLYVLYAPLVHGILLARVPRAEVDDRVQDIFLHAFRKLHTLRDAAAFGP